ncbi:hypothetical protein ASD71_14110 [Achromobacter sp. Root565]|nr:hypothetical protein ASD71_14110 [Achromobacter sp. Root565]
MVAVVAVAAAIAQERSVTAVAVAMAGGAKAAALAGAEGAVPTSTPVGPMERATAETAVMAEKTVCLAVAISPGQIPMQAEVAAALARTPPAGRLARGCSRAKVRALAGRAVLPAARPASTGATDA